MLRLAHCRIVGIAGCFLIGVAGSGRAAEIAAAATKTSGADADALAPGHSAHGEAFNEGPRQAAQLIDGTGKVNFPVTTKDPLAQKFFNQGVGQLHGFWYFEAERSFRQAAALDPQCAMAYWGMAMANTKNDKRARDFLKKAVQHKSSASKREAAWIDALSDYYASKADEPERLRRYVRSLEAIVYDSPDDMEAKAFLALQIWTNGSWMTEKKKRVPISSHMAVDALLDRVLASERLHPVHHYRIHLWDEEKPARALNSAALCGPAAPAIAHMWHMPGHIYSDLHRYADAAWQQEASARVDHAHMMRYRILPDQIHNYAHNNEWLIRNLIDIGRAHDAVALAKNMIELPRHPKYNTADKSGCSAHYGRERLLDVLLKYEMWEDLVALSNTSYLAPEEKNDPSVRMIRALGLAYFALSKPDLGQKQIAALEQLLEAKKRARYAAADEAEVKGRAAKKSEDQITQDMADALSDNAPPAAIEPAISELKGWAALAVGNQAEASSHFNKLKESSHVPKDRLAREFLLSGKLDDADVLARNAVEAGEGEVRPLAVLVEVLARRDKKDDLKKYLERLRTLAAYADIDVRPLARLAEIAKQSGLPQDWRNKPVASKDLGERPPLDSLGPLRWQPTPAPNWKLTDVDGRYVSLEDYRHRPVVVIFYLGSGCVHCVEQLQKFIPLADRFGEAGISLVAISSESQESLAKSAQAVSKSGTKLPFPLLSDHGHEAFKAYRAFDDFEKMPLHATYLIDGEGLARWYDVSYEPFVQPEFLLKEAQRLLKR